MAEMNSADAYLEAINKAMSLHAQKATEGLPYNRTETAEIVDITNKAYGDYVVYNGSTRYHAHSENTNYTLGTKVYVTILNSDYSKEKQIIGKISQVSDRPLKYESPLERYEAVDWNLITEENMKLQEDDEIFSSVKELEGATVSKNYNSWDEDNTEELLANWNLEKDEEGSQHILLYHSKNLQEFEKCNKMFKYLGVSAEFKTLLKSMNPVSGDYGLDIYITYSYTTDDTSSPRTYETRRYRLGSKEMIGAIYGFSTFYKQEALFGLATDENRSTLIHYVGIYFYQDGNFFDIDNNKVPTHYNEELLPCNILMRNLQVRFGDDKPTNAIDEATIYTTNGLFYDAAQLNDKAIEKEIKLRWKHKDYENSNDEITKYNELTSCRNIDSDADVELHGKIHWFKSSIKTISEYRSQEKDDSEHADKIYELIEKYKNTFENFDAWTQTLSTDTYKQMFESMSADDYDQAADIYAQAYNKFKSETNPAISREEMAELIAELGLKRYNDYYYNEKTANYYFTPTGERSLNNAISRIKAGLETSQSVDESLLNTDTTKLAGELWVPLDADTFSVTYLPDRKLATCAVKCIIEYGPYATEEVYDEDTHEWVTRETTEINRNSQYYTRIDTNVLNFTNMTKIPDATNQDLAKGIQISHGPNSQDAYAMYDGNTGKLINSNYTTTPRILVADLISNYTGKSYLNGNEILIWKVPRKNTMISVEGAFSENKEEIINYNPSDRDLEILRNADEEFKINDASKMFENYWYIRWSSMDSQVPVYNELTYFINEYLLQTATKNTIYCFLFKNNQYITGNISLLFQQRGSCGTDYTFILSFGKLVDSNWVVKGPASPALTLNSEYFREIEFGLYNGEGEQINLTEEQKNEIITLWVNRNANGYYSGLNNANKLIFNTERSIYYRDDVQQIYYNRVAVRITGDSLADCRYITLQANLETSTTEKTYNQRKHELDNIVFTQYLPIHVKTEDSYEVNGSSYVFYNDNGSLDQNRTTRYSLVGHDSDLYSTDTKPDSAEANERFNDFNNKIRDAFTGTGLYSSGLITTLTLQFDEKTAELLNIQDIESTTNTDIARIQNRQEELTHTYEANLSREDISDYLVESYTKTYNNQMHALNVVRNTLEERLAVLLSYNNEAIIYKNMISSYEGLFQIVIAADNGTVVTGTKALYYYPAFGSDKHTLKPPSIIVSEANKNIAIDCYFNSQLVYTMPLLMIQNSYAIPALNRWNGKLLVDEDNNQIMAATIAAGTKDSSNRFTGVIMGDIKKENANQSLNGLYGYHQGRQSFGFTVDGKGFLGKSGTGRIEFDGQNGYIQSGNYTITQSGDELRKAGSKINLSSGDIDMYGFGSQYVYDATQGKYIVRSGYNGNVNNSSHTHLSSTSPYFYVGVPSLGGNGNDVDGNRRKGLIYVGDTNYYLQSANYGPNSNGLKLDLYNGTLDSYGRLRITGGSGSIINFSGGKLYLSDDYNTIGGCNIGKSGISTEKWGISSNGDAWFNSVTSLKAGDPATNITGGQGISWDGSGLLINGDIYARDGYFSGTVYAKDGVFNGTVYATDGVIGGCTISNGILQADNIQLNGKGWSTVTYCTAIESLDVADVRDDVVKDITKIDRTSVVSSVSGSILGGIDYDTTNVVTGISVSYRSVLTHISVNLSLSRETISVLGGGKGTTNSSKKGESSS